MSADESFRFIDGMSLTDVLKLTDVLSTAGDAGMFYRATHPSCVLVFRRNGLYSMMDLSGKECFSIAGGGHEVARWIATQINKRHPKHSYFSFAFRITYIWRYSANTWVGLDDPWRTGTPCYYEFSRWHAKRWLDGNNYIVRRYKPGAV